jgi:hypothetical protein
MPEVQQYVALLHEVYQDFCLAKMNGQPKQTLSGSTRSTLMSFCTERTREAETQLRKARDLALNMRHGTPGDDTLTSIRQYADLQRQLDNIAHLTKVIRQSLQRSAQAQT